MRNKIEVCLLTLAAFVAFGCLQLAAQAGSQAAGTASQAAGSMSQGMSSMASDQDVQAKAQARLQHMSSELNLTDDQKEKLKPILQSEFQQFKSIHDDTSLSSDQKHAKMQQTSDSYKSQIQGILTPEQQQKWAAMKHASAENKQ